MKVLICVGSDQRSKAAEAVLKYSVNKHLSPGIDVRFMWLRSGDPGLVLADSEKEYQRSLHQQELIVPGNPRPKKKLWWAGRPSMEKCLTTDIKKNGTWSTDFSGFRDMVPMIALASPADWAIYLDVDMMLRDDIGGLIDEFRDCVPKGFFSARLQSKSRAVTVHSVEALKKAEIPIDPQYDVLVYDDEVWNGTGRLSDEQKLYHFTRPMDQPWKPWPEHYAYHVRPRLRDAHDLFWELAEEAAEVGAESHG